MNVAKTLQFSVLMGIKLDQQSYQPPGPYVRPASESVFSFLIAGLGVSRGLKGVSKPHMPMTGA